MFHRRHVLGTLAGSLAASAAAAARSNSRQGTDVVSTLIDISERSNAALMRGDAASWSELVKLSDDFSLMSPFGGEPSRAAEYTPERIKRMGTFFRNGSFKMMMVETYASKDMVVLALIEYANVEGGGMPAQDWNLRVTLVYQRFGSEWRLVHRHADPLVVPVELAQSAALARGEREATTR